MTAVRPDVDRLLELEERRHELVRASMAREVERWRRRELANEVARVVDEVGAPIEGAFVGPPWEELLERAR